MWLRYQHGSSNILYKSTVYIQNKFRFSASLVLCWQKQFFACRSAHYSLTHIKCTKTKCCLTFYCDALHEIANFAFSHPMGRIRIKNFSCLIPLCCLLFSHHLEKKEKPNGHTKPNCCWYKYAYLVIEWSNLGCPCQTRFALMSSLFIKELTRPWRQSSWLNELDDSYGYIEPGHIQQSLDCPNIKHGCLGKKSCGKENNE